MESSPVISIIAAMSENRVVGQNNRLPWHLPADLRHFKELTVGKPIVMGRRTWESLPGLLPDRVHIVITTDRSYLAEGCLLAHSVDQALEAAAGAPEVMIVGGANLYQQTLHRAHRMYLTLVHARVTGDAFFPDFDEREWRELERESHREDERNPYPYTFITLARISSTPTR
jgi:dihydrofolate reductase